MFPNPVAGLILPRGFSQAYPQFVVTQTALEHANRPPAAIDIGNGRAGSPVYAMASGTVVEARPTLDGVLTIQTPTGWRLVCAHMSGIVASVGQPVTVGEGIGFVGAVSDTLIYAHLHIQVGRHRWWGWEWLDPWPLLDQNTQGEDMNITITRYPALRTWRTRGGLLVGRVLDPPPLSVSGTFAAGSPALSSAEYQITPTPVGWLPGPYQLVHNGPLAGYLIPDSQIDLNPIPAPDGAAAEHDRWLAWLASHPERP